MAQKPSISEFTRAVDAPAEKVLRFFAISHCRWYRIR
jgi:hypothetical protein